MKYLAWFCVVVFGIFTFSYIYYKGKENQVVDGFVQKIETVEDSDGKRIFITISGLAKNMYTYERRVEFNGPKVPVIGQEVGIETPKELKLRVVIKERSEGPDLDKDGWPVQEKKE